MCGEQQIWGWTVELSLRWGGAFLVVLRKDVLDGGVLISDADEAEVYFLFLRG